jgi:hypothetical protein
MGRRKKKNPALSINWNRDPTTSYVDSMRIMTETYSTWLRDPTRTVLIEDPRPNTAYVNGPEGEFTFSMPYTYERRPLIRPEPEPMRPQTIFQELRTMATDPFYAIRTHWELSRKQELEQIALGVLAKKEEKKNENLEIKGKYRERIKELTDENVALKYELEQLKKKYESSTH